MNPKTMKMAEKLCRDVQTRASKTRGVDVVIAPPAVYLGELGKLIKGKKVALGAQDVFFESGGAHTGEISASMLRSVGATYIITGHSERRARGEDDEEVYKDTEAVLKSGATAIVCVGERERDTHGDYLSLVEKQVRTALQGVAKTKLSKVVIAYEPIWAIGTGNTATPQDAHEMKLFIQKVLSDVYGRIALSKVRVLYGGSVNAKNAEALMTEGVVDGFLVGGASLRAAEFASIIKTAGG